MQATSTHDASWVDRCLGEGSRSRISYEPDELAAAVAAATMALDGDVTPPRVDAVAHAPAREAEVVWTVALAALASNRDATALIDDALATADRISDPNAHDRMLMWGALELRARGDVPRAAKWSAALRDADYQRELSAHDVRLRAQVGDLDGARQALSTLPPIWTLMSDESWPWYPRWIGGAAVAACAALASPQVVAAPAARGLIEDAERLSASIDEEWDENRAHRALALAWARLGDLDRALDAASRMPGAGRADAIAELLDGFGDKPGVDLPRLDLLARQAIAATRSAPLVLTDDPVSDKAARDLIDEGVVGVVVAAIARRHIVRKDFVAAEAAIGTIPTNLSVHYEAALQLACARLQRGETALDQVMTTLPPDNIYRSNLVRAAAQVGCLEVIRPLLNGVKYRGRVVANLTSDLIRIGRLDDATSLLRSLWDELASGDQGELLSAAVTALLRSGRTTDAVAIWNSVPALEDKYAEQIALAGGHRLIVALVESGEIGTAKTLRDALAPRLARVWTDE